MFCNTTGMGVSKIMMSTVYPISSSKTLVEYFVLIVAHQKYIILRTFHPNKIVCVDFWKNVKKKMKKILKNRLEKNFGNIFKIFGNFFQNFVEIFLKKILGIILKRFFENI